jgi:hypothetical protein
VRECALERDGGDVVEAAEAAAEEEEAAAEVTAEPAKTKGKASCC